jgi:hypothetical protein
MVDALDGRQSAQSPEGRGREAMSAWVRVERTGRALGRVPISG